MRRGKSPWPRTRRIARKACRQPSRMVTVGARRPARWSRRRCRRRAAPSPASCSSGDRVAAAFQHHAGDQGDQGGRGEDEHRPSAPQTRIVRLSVTVRPAPGRDRPVRPELSGDGVRVCPCRRTASRDIGCSWKRRSWATPGSNQTSPPISRIQPQPATRLPDPTTSWSMSTSATSRRTSPTTARGFGLHSPTGQCPSRHRPGRAAAAPWSGRRPALAGPRASNWRA